MASDEGRKERLRAIRQLLYGSSDEDVNVSGNVEDGNQKKQRGKKKKKKARLNDARAPAPAIEPEKSQLEENENDPENDDVTVQERQIKIGPRGTIMLHTDNEVPWGGVGGYGNYDYGFRENGECEEDVYDDHELEMFGADAEEEEDAPEDEDGEDTSDSEIEFGLRRAIGVEPEDVANYSTTEDPMNGSQFLLRAIQESQNLPKVAVADPELLRVKLTTATGKKLPPRYEGLSLSASVVKRQRQRPRRKKANPTAAGDATEAGVALDVTVPEAGAEVNGRCDDSVDKEFKESESQSSASTSSDEEQEQGTTPIKTSSTTTPTLPSSSAPSNLDPSSFLPNAGWQAEVLTEFTRLRAKVDRQRLWLEQKKLSVGQNMEFPDGRVESWFRFCFGGRIEYDAKCGKFRKPAGKVTMGMSVEEFCREFLDQFFFKTRHIPFAGLQVEAGDLTASVSSISLEDGECVESPAERRPQLVPYDGHKPLLSILLHIPQRVLETLIEFNLNWLTQNYGQFINTQHCEWLYSLLVCLQLPLEAAVISNLRDIVRECRKQRRLLAQILRRSPRGDHGHGEQDEEPIGLYLNSLNLFITLVGNYFGQKDLLDGF